MRILVIAPPDDESMFFLPTIAQFKIDTILCLTTGNYDGLGATRRQELTTVCQRLGCECRILDDSRFPDRPKQRWDIDIVAKEMVKALPDVQCLVTFDEYGVSGHVNHQDTHYASLKAASHWNCEIHCLHSVRNPLRKYMPLLYALSVLFQSEQPLSLFRPWWNWTCMATHYSQWVWYRRLFVLFSCYTYWNELRLENRHKTE